MDCNPQLADMDEMVQELNKTNDLFGFVRLMRNKFQKATLSGTYTDSHSLSLDPTLETSSSGCMYFGTEQDFCIFII